MRRSVDQFSPVTSNFAHRLHSVRESFGARGYSLNIVKVTRHHGPKETTAGIHPCCSGQPACRGALRYPSLGGERFALQGRLAGGAPRAPGRITQESPMTRAQPRHQPTRPTCPWTSNGARYWEPTTSKIMASNLAVFFSYADYGDARINNGGDRGTVVGKCSTIEFWLVAHAADGSSRSFPDDTVIKPDRFSSNCRKL